MDGLNCWRSAGWLLRAVSAAGFEDGKIIHKYNSYVDTPDPSDALDFGTQGITFCARKPIKSS